MLLHLPSLTNVNACFHSDGIHLPFRSREREKKKKTQQQQCISRRLALTDFVLNCQEKKEKFVNSMNFLCIIVLKGLDGRENELLFCGTRSFVGFADRVLQCDGVEGCQSRHIVPEETVGATNAGGQFNACGPLC